MSGRTWTAGAVSRDPRFREYARRFNAGRFFSAHEVLEELWLEVRGEERDFLQGLVQVAVALEHRARGNAAGAHKVLARARRRLRGYGARHAGVPLSHLLARVEAYLEGSRPEPPRLPPSADGAPPAPSRAEPSTKSETTMTRRMTKTKAIAKAARGKKTPSKGRGTKARAAKPGIRRAAGSRAARTRRAASAKTAAPARRGGAARTARPARRAAASARPRRLSPAKRAPRAVRALEPLEVRRERARAILEGLRFLHPDARCELVHTSALELLVATILSAQCTDVRVNMTTPALFARYRTAGDYASANREELGEIIRSTGFYRNKAKSIIALGKALVERHDGEVPRAMEDLVRLPGVGRKTANVLLAEWYKEPGIAVDTHVIRLTGPVWRLTNEQDPVKIEFALYDLIPEKDRAFFGIATIFHGRRICSARRPNCAGCALSAICPSAFALGPCRVIGPRRQAARGLPRHWREPAAYGKSEPMQRIVGVVLLLAAAALPALAGEVLVSASDISIPKDFLCGEAKKPAGRYGLEVSYEESPAPKSTLKVTKAGKSLCTIEGAGTTQNAKMATTKVRLFTRVDAERKAVEVVVVTPTSMRDRLRNQIFYLPLAESSAQ